MKLELPVCLTVPRVEINVEIYSWFPFASTHAKIQETESLASPNTIIIIIIIIIKIIIIIIIIIIIVNGCQLTCSLSGWPVTEDQLKEVSLQSGVLETPSDFLHLDFRKACEELIPSPEEVEPKHCMDAFLYLKNNFPPNMQISRN